MNRKEAPELTEGLDFRLEQPRATLIENLRTVLTASTQQRVEAMKLYLGLIEDPVWWEKNRKKIENGDYHQARVCRQFTKADTDFLERECGVTAHAAEIGQHTHGNYHCFTKIYTEEGPIIIDSTWKQFALGHASASEPDTFCGTPEALVRLLREQNVDTDLISRKYGPIVTVSLLAATTKQEADLAKV